jgi:molybdate transport repressor ModE-like protein
VTIRRLTDRLLDLDSLVVLDQVASTGSLSATADALGVTQQAVSARVRGMERALGQRLVDRSSAGSVLTDAGRLVVALGAPVLEAADRLEAAAQAMREDDGPLVVAASQTIAELLVPGWIIWFRSASPTTVRLVAGNSGTVVDQVRSGTAHLGFVETPSLPVGLATATVQVDELVVVVAPDHPWASGAVLSPGALAATPLLVREAGSGTRATVDRWFAAAGLGPAAPAAVLESSAVIRAAARSGIAPAVMSLRMVESDVAAGTLVRVAVDGPTISRPFTAVWSEPMSPAAAAFPEVVGGGRTTAVPPAAGRQSWPTGQATVMPGGGPTISIP